MGQLAEKHLDRIQATDIACAVLSGGLLSASFPKIGWFPCAWIALVPLLYAAHNRPGAVALRLGFLTGMIHFTTVLYWIPAVVNTYGGLPLLASWAVLLILVMYLSLYLTAFTGLLGMLHRLGLSACWTAPILWTGLEYLRGIALTGFPWANVGYSQFKWLQVIQISDIFGVYIVSAMIVAVNAVLFECCEAIVEKKALCWKSALCVGALVAAVLIYGAWRMPQVNAAAHRAPQKTVSLVQGNIDQSKKWVPSFQEETIRRYWALTVEALESGPDLVVWPETALPFYFLRDEPATTEVLKHIQTTNAYFVLGSPSFSTNGQAVRYYNSAYLVAPDGVVLDRYDKVHLVPYGEYVPFKKVFPFLGKIVAAVGDFSSGRAGHVLSLNGAPLGVLICFEVIFPDLARALVKKGARLMINLTNDAWFGTTSAPYQHLSMAVFRAVETRRTLARAANTGISAFIDPAGRILEPTELFQKALRTRRVPLMTGTTVYVRYGDFFAIGCLVITGMYVLMAIGTRVREKSKS
ncbi:MAG: apolipoprotein N-acyltransferase [Deltaproteobacteria bacterium]|nr:apolipoprotein N-acyltransferase [Deltaproteobacteria bacterium]